MKDASRFKNPRVRYANLVNKWKSDGREELAEKLQNHLETILQCYGATAPSTPAMKKRDSMGGKNACDLRVLHFDKRDEDVDCDEQASEDEDDEDGSNERQALYDNWNGWSLTEGVNN